jgi:4-amino-4-deoxy-L-arabinose transferase-like glycosyltransferase
LSLLALLLLYMGVALGHAVLAPLTTGPDELAHYEYVSFIAGHGRLPLTPAERTEASYKSDQPPLYHLLVALPAGLAPVDGPPYLKRVTDTPRRQFIERNRHAWGLYNTQDEQWPWRGEVLRWQIGRWVAIFFGMLAVLTAYILARWFFVGRWLPALAAAAIIAFIPRFVLTGSMLNYETMLTFFATLYLAVLLKIAQSATKSTQPHPSAPLLLGLLAGLSIVTKLSALILPLEILLACWLIGRHAGLGWKTRGRWLTLAAVGTLIPVGTWYGFVVFQFNTVAQDGWWAGLLRPLIAADSSDATTNRLLSLLTGGQAGFTAAIENLQAGPPWEWAATFWRTFWVVGIEGVQPGGNQGLIIATALVAVAVAGLLRLWWASARPQSTSSPSFSLQPVLPPRLAISLLALHLLSPLVLPLIRYAVTFSLADTAQGRHILFMAAPAFAILLVWGFSAGFQLPITNYQLPITNYQLSITDYQLPIRYFLFFLPGIFLLGWSLTQLWTMTWAYLPPLPVTTLPAPSNTEPQPLTEAISLIEHTSQFDPAARQVRLDLAWRATALSPVDYLTHVQLLDAAGTPQAEWLGYSANGRYPARAWDKGDTVRDTIWLSTAGLDAGEYTLALNLFPPTRNAGPVLPQPLPLETIVIPESTLQQFDRAFQVSGPAVGAAYYQVWQNGQPLTRPQTFRYREAMPVTLAALPASWQRTVQLEALLPTGETRRFDPALVTPILAQFIVGPDWPTGDYRLRVEITPEGQPPAEAATDIVAHVVNLWERQFTEPPMTHRLDANFADQIKLLGYDLLNNRAAPGQAVSLNLYWQALAWPDDYTIFTKLLAADQAVHGGQDRLPYKGYRTMYWAPGEIVADPVGLPVDADAPDGVYYVNLGLYKEVAGQALSLPLVADGQSIGATSVTIGPIKIGHTPPAFIQPDARPQVALNQPFGDAPNLTLLGYTLDPTPLTPPNSKLKTQNLKLTLFWRSESILPVDYTTFAHLRNATGETIAQQDQPPLGGAYPTSLWDPGEIIANTIDIPLPENLPADTYSLVIGLYDFKTGQRLPVPGLPANEVTLTTVPLGEP